MRLFQRSFFDKLILFYIILGSVCFWGMVYFTNHNITRLLINERTTSLQSQARLIATQYAKDYFEGDLTNVELLEQLDSLKTLLGIDIWITDKNGQLIAASPTDPNSNNTPTPVQLSQLSDKLDVHQSFVKTGQFYGCFSTDTLSVGIPLILKERQVGYIILHASLADTSDIKSGILKVLYLAYLVVMLLSLLLLHHFTKRVLDPLEQINHVASEYRKGNFESPLQVEDKNEIGQLADSLNDMADELQKMEEYRKNFISNVSHDFRSPLTSIKGYLEAIQDGTIPPERQAHYIDVVLGETKRLTKLTSGLIALNDFNSNTLILKKKIFDISEMILTIMDSFEGIAIKKQVRLLPDIPGTPVKAYADPDKIYQVIYNLVDNALKFSNSGSSIFVTLLILDDDKIKISVKDNGEGISDDHQKHIFERFYKADTSRGKDKAGSGLGLAIVKEIIKAHNESITLQSKEHEGADFSFTLPLAPHQ